MSIALPRPGAVERFLGWISSVAWFQSSPVQVTMQARTLPEARFELPMLFAVRASSAGKPQPATDFSVPRVRSWAFAARLKSVAVENVPRSLKAPRRKAGPPAGKALPKKSPRVLKCYKPGTGVPETAPWLRSAKLKPRGPAVVISLVTAGCERTAARGAAPDRLAA
jgi:hypothetical protein